MEAKNLNNLIVKHFDFLQGDYGFKYKSNNHSYVRHDIELEVQHVSGELTVLFTSQKKTKSLEEIISELLNKEFTYPEHFSSLVLSMGDVDSRLAYDAKLMKQYAKDIL